MYYIIKILLSICILVMLGACYQCMSTKIDDVKYPPPGKLIDVGGYCLHVQAMGDSRKPVVVLDAGLGCFSLDWALVQPEIAQFAHVVSYDRAGYGWSDESPHPRTSRQIVRELHTLLCNAGLFPPYILVGHSFGGVNVRLFANEYPDEVAGLVVVDSPHELQTKKLPPDPDHSLFLKYPRLLRAIEPLGMRRLYGPSLPKAAPFSQEFHNVYLAKMSASKYFRAAVDEWLSFKESLKELEQSKRAFGNKPLIVLTAGKRLNAEELGIPEAWVEEFDKSWKELQSDLATQSRKSDHVIATKSDHLIPWYQPEIIVEAVRELVMKK